jgi:hypothetical protein
VDSRRLSADQVSRLRAQLARQCRYLHALVERMHALNWRSEDPLWHAANVAAHAVDDLLRACVVTRRPGGRLP